VRLSLFGFGSSELGIYFSSFGSANFLVARAQDIAISENLQLDQQLNIPDGFSPLITHAGVEVYMDTPTETQFVQVVNLAKGASVTLLHGESNGFDSKPGGYGLPNPKFTRQSLQEAWNGFSGSHSNAVCITNGEFFSPDPDPTPFAFSLKKDGDIVSGGYAVSGQFEEFPMPGQSTPNQKLMLEIWKDHLDIKELTEANFKNSLAPDIIAGLTEDADKNPTSSTTARTFVGIDDANNDGKFEVLLVFNSDGDTQTTAASILRSFSTNPNDVKVMMLDGGGSTQLLCDGQTYVSSPDNPDRSIPQTIVVSSAAEISISPVIGQFYQNPTNGGTFTATSNSTEIFLQTFPVINFNPPSGTIPCSNNTGVGVSTRPFTDVVPQADGSCLTIPAQGNGQQAGVGTLGNFQAVFSGSFAVSAATQVTFNIFSDDGWILSAGPNADGAQPSYVSGPLVNPPSTGPFSGFSIVGSYNTGSSPTQRDLVVDFPDGGTYPFELDYTEGYGGQLALTLKANSQPLPAGGSISGYVYEHDASPGNLLPGSIIQVCKTNGECRNAITSANGQYSINGLASGEYYLTAFPPGSSNLFQSTIGPVNLSVSENLQNQNIVLTGPVPPPAGTSITNRKLGNGGIPIVYWAEVLTLTTQGCVGGTANYEIIQNGSSIRSGTLQESSPGTYTASIQPLYPNHGNARVSITIDCAENPTTTVFDIYIDPSGKVLTEDNLPIPGANVTLYRSDIANGPFEIVPSNSGLMSLINRTNPDLTDTSGLFGWDVVSGYYKVRAEKTNCVSASDHSKAYVESEILRIPPQVTDIQLVLACAADIDVYIGSDLQQRYSILPGESTRASYHLDSGPVKVISTNHIPIIAALRDSWWDSSTSTWTSFVQMMGLPKESLSDTYYFPSYNNVSLSGQLRFGNVDTVGTWVRVVIGGVQHGRYFLDPSEQARVEYALDSGPVVVESETAGVKIIAALRDAWWDGTRWTSFAQMMGMPKESLSDSYYFPSYNNVSLSGQLRFGNVDTVGTWVRVVIGGEERGRYFLDPSEQQRVEYDLDSGPVVIESETAGVKIIAALRDSWHDGKTWTSFVQMMGLPKEQLADTYYLPAYNNVSLSGQLRFGNVDTVGTWVRVVIGGVQRGRYFLDPSEQVRVEYALDSGPVVIESETAGVQIIAALRDSWYDGVRWTSFAQMMGLPALSDTYYFPSYNNVSLSGQLRFGVP
jgi:hypothetical protein